MPKNFLRHVNDLPSTKPVAIQFTLDRGVTAHSLADDFSHSSEGSDPWADRHN